MKKIFNILSVIFVIIGVPIIIYKMLIIANDLIFRIYCSRHDVIAYTLTQQQINNIMTPRIYLGSVLGEFLAIVILFILFFFTKEGLIKRCNFKKVKPKKFLVIAILMIGFSFLSITFIRIMQSFTTSYAPVEAVMSAAWQVPLEIIGTVIFIPIFEEIIFRGAIFSVLKNNLRLPLAIIIQGVVFAVMHGNLVQSGYTFFLGIILIFTSYYAKSMYGDIFAHMLFNIFGLIIMPIIESFFFNPIIYAIIGIVLIGIAFIMYKKDKEILIA